MSVQVRPEVRQTGQEALHGVGLRRQGVRVASDRTKGVQFVIEVGEAREDVADVRLDLADALQARLQGGAAVLDLMERNEVR